MWTDCAAIAVAGSRDGASPVGAAPLDRSELSKVLGRPVGPRAHGSYSLSMQQQERMAPLRKEIESLVERFNASPEVKARVKQNAEKMAVKIMDELGPTEAAIASVAQEFIAQGRNLAEVSSCIAMVHSGMDQLKDLIVEVLPAPEGEIQVLVNGRERPFTSYPSGIYRKLRIPLFASDLNALVELRNARLTRNGYDEKRVEASVPTEFVVKANERNFELFKVLKKARIAGGLVAGSRDPSAILRTYSISKLPFTEELLREANLLQAVSAEYASILTEMLKDGRGRSPRKLAEEALLEACESVVPEPTSSLILERRHLNQSRVKSLLVLPELSKW